MISTKLQDAINYQINRELFSEYYYLSMASYFNSVGLSGFENFFLVQVYIVILFLKLMEMLFYWFLIKKKKLFCPC